MNEKLLKLLLILLVCLPMTSTDIFVPALPIMVTKLHTDVATIDLVLSSYMIGFAVSVLTTGTLSDIYGRRKILIYTMSLYIATCLLIVFCNNVYLLIFLRFFQGLGGGTGNVVGRLILKDYFPHDKQVNMMGVLSTGMAVAPAIAPQIGAFCVTYFNWQSCFFITFLLGCFILLVLVFKFKETNQTLSTHNPIKHLPLSLIGAFNTREFAGYTLLVMFTWSAYFSFIGLSSFLFQKVYLYSESQYALVIGVVTFGYLLGVTFTRFLDKKQFSLFRIIKLGVIICLCGGGLFFMSYILHLGLFVIFAMFIIRFGIGLIMPTSQVGAMRVHLANMGWYLGCLFFVEFIFCSLVLYFAGFLELIQIGTGMVTAVVTSVILLLLGLALIKTNFKKDIICQ